MFTISASFEVAGCSGKCIGVAIFDVIESKGISRKGAGKIRGVSHTPWKIKRNRRG